FPEPPPPEAAPGCGESGVLGVVPGLLGLMQAAEVHRLVLGLAPASAGRLILVDAETLEFREVRATKSPDCPVCSPRAEPKPLGWLATPAPALVVGQPDAFDFVTPQELRA